MPYGAQVAVRYSYQIQLPYRYNICGSATRVGDGFVSLTLAPNFPISILAQFQLIYIHYNSISQHNAANFRQICMPHIDLLIVSATCCCLPPGTACAIGSVSCNPHLASRMCQELQINQLRLHLLQMAAALKSAVQTWIEILLVS